MFMRQLEDAIERHMTLLSKINDIAHFTSKSETGASNDGSNNDEGDNLEGKDAGSDDDASEEGADDLGLDVKKSKQQATDEMDYEDSSDNEQGGLPTDRNNSEGDRSDHGEEDDDDDDVVPLKHDESPVVALTKDLKDETPHPLKSRQSPGKSKSSAEQNKSESGWLEKKTDRAIYVNCDGRHFEAHFKFPVTDPHIMLTQIVQRTAKKVAVKSPGDIDQCKVVEIHLDDSGSSKSGGIPMLRKGKESRIALQTAGVDFSAFWELKDDLDVNYISSNSVDAILRTYGIEAARATIITEIFRVFNHYGVSVDMRHLMLVADFMTHTGEYRSMNRVGGIAESNSPFARMCFETASKFIVEAATQSEKDDLETPSARVCLGLPAKVGTGCFDLLHELNF